MDFKGFAFDGVEGRGPTFTEQDRTMAAWRKNESPADAKVTGSAILAKVGVEGSNPVARSRFHQEIKVL
jgi:hypothetical protein